MKLTPIVAPLFGALVLLSACQRGERQSAPDANMAEAAIAPILTTPDAVDVHSFARPLEARVTHVALDVAVDFDARRIGGTAILDIERRADARQIILDDNGLEIESVTDAAKRPLRWQVG